MPAGMARLPCVNTDDPTLPRGPSAPVTSEDPGGHGVLLLDIEPPTAALFDEWLALDGRRIWHGQAPAGAVDLIVTALAFPRQGGRQRLESLRHRWPGVAVVVLSPTFLVGVSPRGEVARQLGATAVLPAPVTRETLRATVNGLLRDSA
jgi:DNA-binding NarL/FixJ family response regulator